MVGDVADDLGLAESLRWGVSRLSSRLRAEQPGSDRTLTRLAASVLANLTHSGPLTASELAAIEGLQPQSLTRVINELHDHGRIRRSRNDTDARQQDIAITEAGRAALREHVRDGNRWLAAALRHTMTDAERGVLAIAADLLRELAEAEVSGTDTAGPPRSARRGDGAAPPL
ncbi:MarR family winged helix-turn-helix transcriptional regulator [Nocardia sp. NPDC052316]|uniref:MarR family winged helix-turn-helix transcriptional regulator n=1 Tax=Nocardia sp. NPDC052316 TaxID=3364329 RepID=UPI0037C89356